MKKKRKPDSTEEKPAAGNSSRDVAAKTATETFLLLSQVLTAESSLPDDLVDAYFKRAQDQFGPLLVTLLTQFAALVKTGRDPIDIVRQDIFPDEIVGPTAKTILLLWYTGGIRNAAGDWEMQSADQYYRALVWEAIGAHPPTLSNGYYGHWKYPAER